MNTIVLASGNQGKLKELQSMLSGLGIEVLPQSAFDVGSVAETGSTFVENALIKARHAAAISGHAAVSDDSGLEVDALDGRPGIYSARFAGAEASDEANNRKLLEALADVEPAKRTARFHSVVVLLRHKDDPVPLICHGSWDGTVLEAPQGSGGFGYDPLFWIPELGKTSAELSSTEKNRLSHRAKAMEKLLQQLRQL